MFLKLSHDDDTLKINLKGFNQNFYLSYSNIPIPSIFR